MLSQEYRDISEIGQKMNNTEPKTVVQYMSQLTAPELFSEDPLEEAALRRILDAGRLAPSAKNRQPWRFIAVTSDTMRATIAEACYSQEVALSAPAFIVQCTTNTEYKMPNGMASHPLDHGMAASFMILQAAHEGYGVKPMISFMEDDVKSALSVPFSMRVVVILALGKPVKSEPLVDRLPFDRVTSFNHW